MKLAGFAITMGIGLAAGAVTAMMLPRHSTTRRALQRAAHAVEDAKMNMSEMLSEKMEY